MDDPHNRNENFIPKVPSTSARQVSKTTTIRNPEYGRSSSRANGSANAGQKQLDNLHTPQSAFR
jgi:hypothetical protein